MLKRLIEKKYRIVSKDLSKEADSFTKAVRLDEIPQEYKHLKVIGRGNTSITLEKDPETVIMITRDEMKKEWLWLGLEITKDWKVHDIKAKNKKFKDFNIYSIEMPKLYKLDSKNKKFVKQELAYLVQAFQTLGLNEIESKRELRRLLRHYQLQGKEHSIIYPLLDFLQHYGSDTWNWDLHYNQFLQDKQGKIVLIDPIVATKLVSMMWWEPNKPEFQHLGPTKSAKKPPIIDERKAA